MTALLDPLPPKTIPETGKRAVLLEAADKVRLPTAVSRSPIVKAIAEVAVSSVVDWLLILESVGAVLGGASVVKVWSVEVAKLP